MFTKGYRFEEPMTYKELRAYVALSSCRIGGPKLRAQCRKVDTVPDYVTFYCQHGRKHLDQSNRKEPANPRSSRAKRQDEERRILYCECKFSMCVRRDMEYVPVACEEEGKSSAKCKWYVDSQGDQVREKRYRFQNNCFKHSGHIRRSLPISDVTACISQYIVEHAKHNVGVSSIQSLCETQSGSV